MSQGLHWVDLVSLLNRVAEDVDPVATCNAVYALLPDPGGLSFAEAAAYAARVYHITAQCLNWDWSQELLAVVDRISDGFELFPYFQATEEDVLADLRQFAQDHRDEQIVRLLEPVRWSD